MSLRRYISTISGKNISLTFIIIIIIIITFVIIINIISIINLVVTLANHFFINHNKEKAKYFFAASTESGQAANGEKTKYILQSREQERRQNGNIRVANMFFENVANF